MKRFIWFAPVLVGLLIESPATAQFYGQPGRGYAFGLQYRSGRLSISGMIYGNYGGFAVGPYAPAFAPPPVVIERRVIREVYAPPTVVVPPIQHEYDVTGVDLDLIHPPTKIGPNGPEPPKSEKPLPGGKDRSVFKRPVRPGQKPQPPAAKKPGPPRPPQPPPPAPDPKVEAENLINLGAAEFNDGKYGLARQRWNQATRLDPKNSLAWFLRGQAEIALGFYKQAHDSIVAGMKLRPDWPKSTFRPRTQLFKGREVEFDQQLKQLAAAVKRNPKSAPILFVAAHQYWFDSRRKEAIRLFRLARAVAADRTYIDLFLKASPAKVVRK